MAYYQQQSLILVACLNYFSHTTFSNYSRLSVCGGCQSLTPLLKQAEIPRRSIPVNQQE
jgi:hypothetical protein